jgi:outer membrane protein TolC
MIKSILASAAASLTLLAFSAVGEQQAPAEPESAFAGNDELAQLLVLAAENNPTLRAMHEQWRAAVLRAPQAESLDDPVLSYTQFLQSETNRFRIAVSQRFPWFGTLEARGDRARAEANAELSQLLNARNRVFANVKQTYAEYRFLKQRIEVTESLAEVLDYMEEVVRAKLSLGMADQDELLRIAMEKARLEDRYAMYLQQRPAAAAQLNEAVGLDADLEAGPRDWPGPLTLPPPPPPPPVVLARVRTANPALDAYDAQLASSELALELARLEGWPSFNLGLDYTSISKPRKIRPDRPYPATLNAINRAARTAAGKAPFDPVTSTIDMYSIAAAREPMARSDGGEDNIAVSLSVTLPFWRQKVQAGVAEAKALEQAVVHQKREAWLDLTTQARQALFELQDAVRRRALYKETLLPLAEQTYESLQSSYAAGRPEASFLDMMEAIRQLLDYGLEQVRAEKDIQDAAAELEYLMGGPWATGELEGGPISAEPVIEVERFEQPSSPAEEPPEDEAEAAPSADDETAG